MLRFGLSVMLAVLMTGTQIPDSNIRPPQLRILSSGRLLAESVGSREKTASKRAAREIRFSGYEWRVKSSDGQVGPGPNYFSDAPDTVWVDNEGRLHLRINNKYGHWWSAEIISKLSFGYGRYRFHLTTNVDDLEPNAVLGLFTWSDDPAFSHREIDIEISRWGQENNENGQCVIQPYSIPQNGVRFELPPGLTSSVHSFEWQPQRVSCQSIGVSAQSAWTTIHAHTSTEFIPPPGDENARINLWLLGGQAPRYGRDVEVVISRFVFVPL